MGGDRLEFMSPDDACSSDLFFSLSLVACISNFCLTTKKFGLSDKLTALVGWLYKLGIVVPIQVLNYLISVTR